MACVSVELKGGPVALLTCRSLLRKSKSDARNGRCLGSMMSDAEPYLPDLGASSQSAAVCVHPAHAMIIPACRKGLCMSDITTETT